MAYVIYDVGQLKINLYEFGGRETPLISGGENMCPLWAPDDSAIVYSCKKDGFFNLYEKELEGSKGPIALTRDRIHSFIAFFTPDRKQMVFGAGVTWRIAAALAPVDEKSNSVSRIDMSQEGGVGFLALHPNGSYLAYLSQKNGSWDIYVQTFPALDRKWLVSANGGEEVRWNPKTGQELIYRWGCRWMQVDVKFQATKPEFSVPRELFSGAYINVPGYSWDISPDGERFLLLENQEQSKPVTQLTVITNFLDELNRRLPPGK